jgi:heme-degrading monooxygenase HmoA
MQAFAPRPKPPYYAVIFTSRRSTADTGYEPTVQRMVALAQQQAGFLGVESARGSDGVGITVSYWRSESDICAFRGLMEHHAARDRGRAEWYSHYELRVAKVERAYGWDTTDGPTDPCREPTCSSAGPSQ